MVHLSIVIVTKNRALELSHCLGSLLSNSLLPKEIIVIDNNSNDDTKQLLMNMIVNVNIAVKYINTKSIGYPKIYNRGLKEAKGNWVAFIDDDCVADINWISEILSSIKKYPKHAAIMGWCETYYSDNVFSQTTNMFDNDWKQRSLNANKVLDLEVLDTKNIVFNNKFLKSRHLSFDNSRSSYVLGAAQDCDFGIQIQNASGKAVVNKKMIISHKDPCHLIDFIKKDYLSWKSYNSLEKKWNLIRRYSLKNNPIPITRLVKNYGNKYSLTKFQQFWLLIVSKQILLFNRLLKLTS
ncbi:MAG: glycosyltransferase family 2 protein [Pseudomonadales bacterium]|nr:glycosyltransferase family 2 protein [Pseudomonadales bacterium]